MANSVTAAQARSTVTMEDRQRLTLNGVTGMGAATPTSVYAETSLGGLAVKGGGLHIVKFSQEEGILVLQGKIDSLVYTESQAKQPLLKRFFR